MLRGTAPARRRGMVLFAKASGCDRQLLATRPHRSSVALETISALSDVPIEEIATATDGRGVVSFGMPLRGWRLRSPAGRSVRGRDPPLQLGATRIRDAMMAHPELVAANGVAIDTAVMRALPSRS